LPGIALIHGQFRKNSRRAAVVFLLTAFSTLSSAEERNEVGFAIGAALTPSRSLDVAATVATGANSAFSFKPGFAFVADYYRGLFVSRKAALSGGVSIAVSPFDVITKAGPADGIKQYAYLFMTSEVRLKFAAAHKVQPWLSFGGGSDIRTPFSVPILKIPLSARIQVRDYYSGSPNCQVAVAGSRQHTVIVSAGIVLRR
jgi:hypothetical protein